MAKVSQEVIAGGLSGIQKTAGKYSIVHLDLLSSHLK